MAGDFNSDYQLFSYHFVNIFAIPIEYNIFIYLQLFAFASLCCGTMLFRFSKWTNLTFCNNMLFPTAVFERCVERSVRILFLRSGVCWTLIVMVILSIVGAVTVRLYLPNEAMVGSCPWVIRGQTMWTGTLTENQHYLRSSFLINHLQT